MRAERRRSDMALELGRKKRLEEASLREREEEKDRTVELGKLTIN